MVQYWLTSKIFTSAYLECNGFDSGTIDGCTEDVDAKKSSLEIQLDLVIFER